MPNTKYSNDKKITQILERRKTNEESYGLLPQGLPGIDHRTIRAKARKLKNMSLKDTLAQQNLGVGDNVYRN